jgi:hypothetical protein
MAIREFLTSEASSVPDELKAMSMTLEDVCNALKLNGNAKAREIVAIRIIEFGVNFRTDLICAAPRRLEIAPMGNVSPLRD